LESVERRVEWTRRRKINKKSRGTLEGKMADM
jgi:hypothetical protein